MNIRQLFLGCALSVVSCAPLPGINWAESNGMVRAGLQWESEYVFRGIKQGGGTLIPSAGVSLFGFYADMEWLQPIQHSSDSKQWNGYLGYRTELLPFLIPDRFPDLSLEMGMVYRHYSESTLSHSREFYVGVELQGLGSSTLLSQLYPRFHLLYDLDRFDGMLTAQGSVGYDLYLDTQWPIWIYLEPFLGWSQPELGENWFFYGIQADLKYAIQPGLVASAGVRYSGKSVRNPYLGEDSDRLWWSSSIRYEF